VKEGQKIEFKLNDLTGVCTPDNDAAPKLGLAEVRTEKKIFL
jgi:hypothetical protein